MRNAWNIVLGRKSWFLLDIDEDDRYSSLVDTCYPDRSQSVLGIHVASWCESLVESWSHPSTGHARGRHEKDQRWLFRFDDFVFEIGSGNIGRLMHRERGRMLF